MARKSKVTLEITPEFYIAVAAALILVPLKWMCAWFVAILVHEFSHCFALLLCGKHVEQIRIGMRGAIIKTNSMEKWQQVFCTFAGPVGSILLLPLRTVFPRLAVCGFVQSVYNLIPVLPLDGGLVLWHLLSMLFSDVLADKIVIWVERILLGTIILFCFVGVIIFDWGVSPAIVAVCLLLRIMKIKIPCKSTPHRVQ